MTLPRRAWVRLNSLRRPGIGCFRSSLYKWGIASSAACEYSAEEQTVYHIILKCSSNTSTFSWTARPGCSGQWDNWMAAQHLPRDLMRASSGYKNWLERRRMNFSKTLTCGEVRGWGGTLSSKAKFRVYELNWSSINSPPNWLLSEWLLLMLIIPYQSFLHTHRYRGDSRFEKKLKYRRAKLKWLITYVLV